MLFNTKYTKISTIRKLYGIIIIIVHYCSSARLQSEGSRGWETVQLVDIGRPVTSSSETAAVGLGRTWHIQGAHCSHYSQTRGEYHLHSAPSDSYLEYIQAAKFYGYNI